MEQVLGEHIESERADFSELVVLTSHHPSCLLQDQNRAYAVAQLNDLHQKLVKAQSTVSTTRAPQPMLNEDKPIPKVSVFQSSPIYHTQVNSEG